MPNWPQAFLLIPLLLSVGVAHAGRRTEGHVSLLDRYLSIDSKVVDTSADPVHSAASVLRERAATCTGAQRETCVLAAVVGSDGLMGLRVASSPAENTATHALTERRGSCAAIVAVLLAVGEELKIPFTAIVLREHVLLGSAADPGLAYEVLDQGKPVRLSELHRYGPMPPDGVDPVRAADFIPYYLDNLAARLAEAGALEPAERTFREAIHLAPKVARLRYNLGTFLVHRERYKEADAELARAIHLGWKDADAHVNRGVARWKLGKLKDARRDFEEALRLEPGNRDAVANLRLLGVR
jgi:hypothetical protein